MVEYDQTNKIYLANLKGNYQIDLTVYIFFYISIKPFFAFLKPLPGMVLLLHPFRLIDEAVNRFADKHNVFLKLPLR